MSSRRISLSAAVLAGGLALTSAAPALAQGATTDQTQHSRIVVTGEAEVQVTESTESRAEGNTTDTGQTLHDAVGDETKSWFEAFQSWLDDRYQPKDTPDEAPTDDPTEGEQSDAPSVGTLSVWLDDDDVVNLQAIINDYTGPVTFRVSDTELTGQPGQIAQGEVGEDGIVKLTVDTSDAETPKFYQIEAGGTADTYGEIITDGPVNPIGDNTGSPVEPSIPIEEVPNANTDEDTDEGQDVDARVQEVLDAHNTYREEQGFEPLALSREMSEVALDWSVTMAETGEFVHNPDYSTQIPEGASKAAENIAYGPDVADIMEGWIASEGHEANITGDFTHAGIGLAEKDGTIYATVNFGNYAEDPDGSIAEETPEDADGATIFSADFAENGLPGNYAGFNPQGLIEGRDYGIVDDPAGGNQQVAYFDSGAELTNGNDSPRASAITENIIEPDKEYRTEISFYLPEDQALNDAGDWTSIGTGGYGEPYNGASPTNLMIVRPDAEGPHLLRLGDDPDLLGDVEIPTDTWVTVTMEYKASQDGWIQLSVDTGDGAEPVQIDGQDRTNYAVIQEGVNDGGDLYSSVGSYGNEPRRVYFSNHTVSETTGTGEQDTNEDTEGTNTVGTDDGTGESTGGTDEGTGEGTEGTDTEGTSGGTGGEFTNAEDVSFTANGITSTAHIFAEGRTGNPGLLVWMDGSGGSGYDNPDSDYAIGGENGLEAIARERNMILVVPVAPAPDCDGEDNCWYNQDGTPTPADKAGWLAALVEDVKSQYDVNEDRLAVGGYSSGAQGTTRWTLPLYGEALGFDLAIAVAYGGAPADEDAAQFSDEYKANTVVVFNTGTADEAYGDASYEAGGGAAWYEAAGFTVDPIWPEGVGHGRSGEFGGIAADAIDEHLPAA